MISVDQRDINNIIKALQGISTDMKKEVQSVLAENAEPLVEDIKASAPTFNKVVKRYSTAKASKAIRAPKGSGNVVAEYHPGNLGRSFKVLRFRKAKYAVFVGPKRVRNAKGIFKGARADGYYAHMVEFGTRHSQATPFVRPAALRTGAIVLKGAAIGLKRVVLKSAAARYKKAA